MIATLVVIFHFVFDWLLQTRDMAKNKSKDPVMLAAHLFILTVGSVLLGLLLVWLGHHIDAWKLYINVISHGVIDWYIWRAYKAIKMRNMLDEADWDLFMQNKGFANDAWFFNFIAIDQCLHLVIAMWAFNA